MATGILANPAPDQKNGRLDMRIKNLRHCHYSRKIFYLEISGSLEELWKFI